MPITRSWQRELDQKDQSTVELQRQLAEAREALATIDRICQARGIRAPNMAPLQRVRLLAGEHEARSAMVRTLWRATGQEAPANTFESEPLPDRPSPFYVGDRYVSDAETARCARNNTESTASRRVTP